MYESFRFRVLLPVVLSSQGCFLSVSESTPFFKAYFAPFFAGTVYRGVWQLASAVALKSLKDNEKDAFEQEAALLMQMRHPNVGDFSMTPHFTVVPIFLFAF